MSASEAPALTILLPVRNEEMNLRVMLRIIRTVLEYPHEVLVVHDTLDDRSIPIVREAQSKAPGFVSRQTLIGIKDPAQITTLVVWTTNEIYDAWRASPERAAAMRGAGELWAKHPESERFQVVG